VFKKKNKQIRKTIYSAALFSINKSDRIPPFFFCVCFLKEQMFYGAALFYFSRNSEFSALYSFIDFANFSDFRLRVFFVVLFFVFLLVK
jgi:hypothetical protein